MIANKSVLTIFAVGKHWGRENFRPHLLHTEVADTRDFSFHLNDLTLLFWHLKTTVIVQNSERSYSLFVVNQNPLEIHLL